jgi:hypothetical protein
MKGGDMLCCSALFLELHIVTVCLMQIFWRTSQEGHWFNPSFAPVTSLLLWAEPKKQALMPRAVRACTWSSISEICEASQLYQILAGKVPYFLHPSSISTLFCCSVTQCYVIHKACLLFDLTCISTTHVTKLVWHDAFSKYPPVERSLYKAFPPQEEESTYIQFFSSGTLPDLQLHLWQQLIRSYMQDSYQFLTCMHTLFPAPVAMTRRMSKPWRQLVITSSWGSLNVLWPQYVLRAFSGLINDRFISRIWRYHARFLGRPCCAPGDAKIWKGQAQRYCACYCTTLHMLNDASVFFILAWNL